MRNNDDLWNLEDDKLWALHVGCWVAVVSICANYDDVSHTTYSLYRVGAGRRPSGASDEFFAGFTTDSSDFNVRLSLVDQCYEYFDDKNPAPSIPVIEAAMKTKAEEALKKHILAEQKVLDRIMGRQ